MQHSLVRLVHGPSHRPAMCSAGRGGGKQPGADGGGVQLSAETVRLVTMAARPEGSAEARAILDVLDTHFSFLKNVYKYYSMKFTARCTALLVLPAFRYASRGKRPRAGRAAVASVWGERGSSSCSAIAA
jgi:hypothetical protein